MSTTTQATAHRPLEWRGRTVENDGISIAVFEAGSPGKPPLLLVHGWPDTHHLWTEVAAALQDDFHLIAYDTRGYGDTTRPRSVARYRLPELAGDLFAVARAVSPDRPVHVLAHDWGSVQAWEAVTTDGAENHLASFVSISGPNLDHLGTWARERLARPTPSSLRAALSQVASSASTGIFQLPVLPVLVTKVLGLPGVWPRFIQAIEGTDPAKVVVGPTFRADTTAGLAYYRANIRPGLLRPNPRSTEVPVLEIVNHRDIALRPPIFDNSRRYARNLWRLDTKRGHWLPFSNPDTIAAITKQFIGSLGGDADPAIELLRVTEAPTAFTNTLAVITGAGSGIGRETALALASRGAEVALADIDIAAAKTVAETIEAAGGSARAYQLDVADEHAFAETVAAIIDAQGVPDIVVNNAGVALAGDVLDATDAQIRRLVDINLTGVITGSRLFGKAMVERGIGGHIVNIASAAAFSPQRGLGAYAATKAGGPAVQRVPPGRTSRQPHRGQRDLPRHRRHQHHQQHHDRRRRQRHRTGGAGTHHQGLPPAKLHTGQGCLGDRPVDRKQPGRRAGDPRGAGLLPNLPVHPGDFPGDGPGASGVASRHHRHLARADIRPAPSHSLGADMTANLPHYDSSFDPGPVDLHARDVHFDLSDAELEWIPGHPVPSHVINTLNLFLPEGERWFVRTFNEALSMVRDEQLATAMRGFIGQEAVHADTHDKALTEYLVRGGIDPAPAERQLAWIFRRLLEPRHIDSPCKAHKNLTERLWLIAAIEHYTAVLGDFALNSGWTKGGAHPGITDMFQWHGAEEVEHRSVAHDVATYFDNSYLSRVRAMSIAIFGLVTVLSRTTRYLLKADPNRKYPPTLVVHGWLRGVRAGHVPSLWSVLLTTLPYFSRKYDPADVGSTAQAVAYLAASPGARGVDK